MTRGRKGLDNVRPNPGPRLEVAFAVDPARDAGKISTDGVTTTASSEARRVITLNPLAVLRRLQPSRALKGWEEGGTASSSAVIERRLRNVAATPTSSWRSLAFLLSLVCALVALLAFAGNAGAITRTGGSGTDPWIASELPDYPPGGLVNLMGGSWQPG